MLQPGESEVFVPPRPRTIDAGADADDDARADADLCRLNGEVRRLPARESGGDKVFVSLSRPSCFAVGCICFCSFDGDLRLQRLASNVSAPMLSFFDRQRGRSPRQQSDPEHTRQISPARDAWDHPIFETKEAREGFFVSTWDLEDIKDMHELDAHDLDPWFKSFGSNSDTEVTGV